MKVLASLLLSLTPILAQEPPHPTGIHTCGVNSYGYTYAYIDNTNQEFILGLGAYPYNLSIGYFVLSDNPIRPYDVPGIFGDLCITSPAIRFNSPSQLLTNSQHQITLPFSMFVPGQYYFFQAYYKGLDGLDYFSSTRRIGRP